MMWHPFDELAWAPSALHGKLIWIFLISGVVALIVWIAGLRRGDSARPAIERSSEVLKTRYASGEIGSEQFGQIPPSPGKVDKPASEARAH